MQIREFSKPVTAAKLNESLAKRFGSKINIDAFTTEQLHDVRNKLRTKVFNVETTESFDAVQKQEYNKNKMFLDVVNAALAEREDIVTAIDEAIEQVNEGAEDAAELVMAAKDMVDRVTGWMEDTAEMQTESMLELADAIRDEMGSEQAEAFTNSIKPALESLYATMESTREALTQGVGMLTGETEPMDTMGAEAPEDSLEPTVDGEMDMDAEVPTDDMAGDEFDAADAAAGGEEESGREKRESIERSKKK
jgi:myosin heavy subunit